MSYYFDKKINMSSEDVEFYGNGCYNYRMTEELKLLRKATQKKGARLWDWQS